MAITAQPEKPLVIENWQNGIADSPELGFGLMKLVDVESFPGVARVQPAPASLFPTAASGTFTYLHLQPPPECFTLNANNCPATGTAVTFSVSGGGVLPTGITAGTVYYVIQVSINQMRLATTLANALAGNFLDPGNTDSTPTCNWTTVNPGTINHIIRDARADVRFMSDSNGLIWFVISGSSVAYLLNDSGAPTGGAGQGIALLCGSDGTDTWLFSFRSAKIDVVKVTGTTQLNAPSWSDSWQSLNSGAGSANPHHAIRGQDNIIYAVDDHYVVSIQEKAGQVFDPTNAATYTYNNAALTLPLNELGNWLCELGVNLLVAGNTFNYIYPWDRSSISYSIPLQVPEISIKRLKNVGNLVYILAGSMGNIYTTQGSYVKFFKKIPGYVSNSSSTLLVSNPLVWGGIDSLNGALLVGAGVQNNGNSGCYKIFPDGRLTLHQIPSASSTAVTAFETQNDFFFMGYASGADNFGGAPTRYANYNAVIQTQFYMIGNKTKKAKYSQLEIQLARATSSGKIRIKYRTDDITAFADFPGGAVLVSSDTVTSYNFDIGLTNIENLQLQIEFDGNVEIKRIALYP